MKKISEMADRSYSYLYDAITSELESAIKFHPTANQSELSRVVGRSMGLSLAMIASFELDDLNFVEGVIEAFREKNVYS